MKNFEKIFPERRFENLSLLDNVTQATILSCDNSLLHVIYVRVNYGSFHRDFE